MLVIVWMIIALHWCPLPGGDCTQPRILFLAAPRPNCTLNASHSQPSHTQSQNCCPHKHNVSAALIGSWPLYTGAVDQWQALLQAVALVDGWAACTGTGRCGAGSGHSQLTRKSQTRDPGPAHGIRDTLAHRSLLTAALSAFFLSLSLSLSPRSHQYPTKGKNVRSSPIESFFLTTNRQINGTLFWYIFVILPQKNRELFNEGHKRIFNLMIFQELVAKKNTLPKMMTIFECIAKNGRVLGAAGRHLSL